MICLTTLVPEVFLDFSSRKRSRASREPATTSRESGEEREKNLWLPWPRISLSCWRQGQDLTLRRWLVDSFSNAQTNLIGSFNCNYRGDAEDFHTSFCLSLLGKKIVCMLHGTKARRGTPWMLFLKEYSNICTGLRHVEARHECCSWKNIRRNFDLGT